MHNAQPDESPSFYWRRLPHWQPPGATVFVTYRLAGSLPAHVLSELRAHRIDLERRPHRRGESDADALARIGKQYFAHFDTALMSNVDDGEPSPRWLADPRIAALVRNDLKSWDGVYYQLRRYVVMPNHVHILINPLPLPEPMDSLQAKACATQPVPQALACGNPVQDDGPDSSMPCYPLRHIMQQLKGATSYKANMLLARRGSFWAIESFDHWVRSPRELARIQSYIDFNPVSAGLCTSPEQWEWSSAHEERQKKHQVHAEACATVPPPGTAS